MDNKITKERLNNHLEYDWFKYVLILIVSIALFYFVFQQINANRDFETIYIFTSGYELKDNTFCDETLNELRANGDKTLRSISLENQSPTSDTYGTLLMTHGDVLSDILILGKTYAQTRMTQYLEWDEDVIEQCVPEYYRDKAEYLTFTDETHPELIGRKYGIRIDNLKNIGDLLGLTPPNEIPEEVPEQDLGKYDTEFYLVLSRDSYNIGSHSRKKKAKAAHTQAFLTVKRLITVYNPESAA